MFDVIKKKIYLKNPIKMSNSGIKLKIWDNGGRRSGIDRRYYSYSGHIPERRLGSERRMREDRRSGKDRRQKPRVIDFNGKENGVDRRKAWKILYM